jgi:competence protein ComEA
MEQWVQQYRGLLFVTLILLVLAGLVFFQTHRPEPDPILLSTATPLPSPEASPTARPMRVYVSGAVKQPDVYALPPDSIVKDALLAAGGPASEADLDRINLALAVTDGQQIHVPRLGEDNLPVEPASDLPDPEAKININTADQATLESLPGIGPALAQRILDYRQANGPFGKADDIMEVSGIGPATFEQIRGLITTN